ncbi:hypothetical protein Tco_0635891 [Tanacetum coccineum]
MSNIEKIKFPALDIIGANYIQWTGYVKRHLKSMGALATLQEGNKCSEKTKAKDDVFLHQHIDEMLEFEYSNCNDPSILWKDLETRFNNQREVLLPSARDEWNNLRFQDFKKVNVYTSALFRICRTLRFSEENNELLMKNHQTRPIGSLALPEANAINNNDNKNSRSKRGRGSANHCQKLASTPSHLCDFTKQSSENGKEKEVNHVDQFDNTNTELIASDFFNDLEL